MENVGKIDKLKEDYLKRLENSLMDANNVVDNTIRYITKEYNDKMSFHIELSMLYKLKQEYNKLIKKHEARKANLKKIYYTALDRLDKCKTLPDSNLNKYLYDIRNEFRGNLPEGIKYSKMLSWRKSNVVISNKEYKNMYSRINNLTTLVSKRMLEAKKTHQKLLELSAYYIVKNTMDNLNSSLEYDEISSLITNCASGCSNINKKLKNGKNDFNALISSFDKLNEDKLTLDVLQHIDKKINDILSPAYLSFLNDSKKYHSLVNVYNEEKPNLLKELAKYRKKVEKIKKMILHNMYLKYNELENVMVLNNKTTNILSDKTSDMSLGDLINLDNRISEDLVKSKKEFIHNSYLSIIYFYASNDILNKMPSIVYDVYNRFCSDESTFDICFSIIKQQYFKCYYNTYYDLVRDDDKKYVDRACDNLRKDIERIVNTYMNLEINIDSELLEMYRNASELDAISLYELYEKLKRNMNIFTTHNEVKFSK